MNSKSTTPLEISEVSHAGATGTALTKKGISNAPSLIPTLTYEEHTVATLDLPTCIVCEGTAETYDSHGQPVCSDDLLPD